MRPWELEAENWPKKETGGELWLKQLAKAAQHLRNDSGGWSFSKLEELFGNPLKILRVYM